MFVSTLPIRCTDVSTGDSHSVFYSTEQNEVYFCGLYRYTMEGKVGASIKYPARCGQETWKKNCTIKKILSGANHTVALTNEGKVYSWGSDDNGKIGRNLKGRDKYVKAMHISALNFKKAKNIFVGKNHSFVLNEKGQLYGWGCNFNGQLGIGTTEDTHLPTLIKELKEVKVVHVDGGDSHTVALTEEGKIYAWGANEEGQVGVGDTFGDYKKGVKAGTLVE